MKKIVGQIIGKRIREWHFLTEELKKRFDLSLLPSANELKNKKSKLWDILMLALMMLF